MRKLQVGDLVRIKGNRSLPDGTLFYKDGEERLIFEVIGETAYLVDSLYKSQKVYIDLVHLELVQQPIESNVIYVDFINKRRIAS